MKLIFPEEGTPASQGDPYLIKANGKYYLYATGTRGVETWRSDRLLSGWKYLGRTLAEEGKKEYWAPCVLEWDGMYYMYYSCMPEGSEDVHEQAIRVASSPSPEGPFLFRGEVLPPFSIDPHVVESGGERYLFYATNSYDGARAGTYVAVDRLLDPFTAEGKPVPAVLPTLDEEIFMRDRFRKGQDWHTVEGPFYFRVGDDHYLIYSGNCYQNEKYFLGYAHAHGKETDLRKLSFRKMPSPDVYAPLLCRNDEEEGTGHNSVISDGGKLYLVYHARDAHAPQGEGDSRTARICLLEANDGTLKAVR